MRQLSTRQKNYLDKLFAANKEMCQVSDLTNDQFNKLEAMNDYETLWQDTDRYLSDKRFNEMYG